MHSPVEGDWMVAGSSEGYSPGEKPRLHVRYWKFGTQAPEAADEARDVMAATEEVRRRADADQVNAWWVKHHEAVAVGSYRAGGTIILPDWVEHCSCGQAFGVTGDRPGPFPESEPIHCPKCGEIVRMYRTAGTLFSFPIGDEQVAEWERLGSPRNP